MQNEKWVQQEIEDILYQNEINKENLNEEISIDLIKNSTESDLLKLKEANKKLLVN